GRPHPRPHGRGAAAVPTGGDRGRQRAGRRLRAARLRLAL
ncbi:MAG: Uncharacterized Nudix hydrolase NudL, partial [uncultured Nocardioidaceae bacterium]